MIRFACDICQAKLKIAEDDLGKGFRCPNCRTRSVVAPAGTRSVLAPPERKKRVLSTPADEAPTGRSEMRFPSKLPVKSCVLLVVLLLIGIIFLRNGHSSSEPPPASLAGGPTEPYRPPASNVSSRKGEDEVAWQAKELARQQRDLKEMAAQLDNEQRKRAYDADHRKPDPAKQMAGELKRASLKSEIDQLRREIARQQKQVDDLVSEKDLAIAFAVTAGNAAIDAAKPGFERDVVRGIAQAGINEIEANYARKIRVIKSSISDLEFQLTAKQQEFLAIR